MLYRKMLKPREQNALRYIKHAQAQTGSMPAYSEIGGAIGLRSRSSVHSIIHDLADRGYISEPRGRGQRVEILIDPDLNDGDGTPIRVPGGAFTPGRRTIIRSAEDLADARFGIEPADTLVLEIDSTALGGSLSVVEVEPQRFRLCRLLESPQGLHLDGAGGDGPRPYDPAVHAIASRVVGLFRSL